MAEERFYTILTNVGKAKIANATLLNSNLTLKTLKVGDGNGTYYNPTEDQEDLKNTVHECAIGAIYIDKKNPNWIISETIIPGSVGGFTIREVGLFDAEGDMIAVGKYPETYKPVVANGASKDLNVRTIFEVSNAENVTLNPDPSVIIATKEDVNNLQEQIDENTTQLNQKVNKSDIVDNLSSTEEGKVLSARQGKQLADKLEKEIILETIPSVTGAYNDDNNYHPRAFINGNSVNIQGLVYISSINSDLTLFNNVPVCKYQGWRKVFGYDNDNNFNVFINPNGTITGTPKIVGTYIFDFSYIKA